ncbi:MAG: 3-deoxy-manno-octulosonate cytidylyltransferase [Bacteroidota bacterium]
MTKILGIIPARYDSSRFPGKPLVDIDGKSMIQRVYEQCQKAQTLNAILVATDDKRIYDVVSQFGGEVVMTASDHQSGTDRCFEALAKQDDKYDYVINVQGDEPFINPEQINSLAQRLDGKVELATLGKSIGSSDELFNPNVVKVVFDKNGKALLFSRSTVPHIRNLDRNQWLNKGRFFKHIGIYAYRTDILASITKLEPSSLEIAESLEQLRWLENGYSIHVEQTEYESTGIDTPEDLIKLKGKG